MMSVSPAICRVTNARSRPPALTHLPPSAPSTSAIAICPRVWLARVSYCKNPAARQVRRDACQHSLLLPARDRSEDLVAIGARELLKDVLVLVVRELMGEHRAELRVVRDAEHEGGAQDVNHELNPSSFAKASVSSVLK